MSESDGGGGCGGCLVFILFCFVISAIYGGVTVDGKHYEMNCGCDGVSFETP